MLRHAIHFEVAAFVAFLTFPVLGSSPLAPTATIRLPDSVAREVHDVAWQDDNHLLIASDRGVILYTIAGGETAEVIEAVPVPAGLPSPIAVATDGSTVVAVSPFAPGSVSVRLSDRKRLLAQQSHKLISSDVATRSGRVCYLGFAGQPFAAITSSTAVLCGAADGAWSELKPLHMLHSAAAAALYRFDVPPYAGAVAMEDDGTVDVITSVEPGLYRYAAGAASPKVVGGDLRELVLNDADKILKQFAADLDGRYRLLLNVRPLVDGVVVTPAGPAIVVRKADHDVISWQLWFPEASGGATQRTALAIQRNGPFGHLRCDARRARMACVGSAPSAADAVDPRKSENSPTLWLFDLKGASRR